MPFDGKNFTETKPDVFSLDGLITWLEKQPADEGYCFTQAFDCLWGAYTKALGGSVFWGPARYEINDAVMSAYLDRGSWQELVANGSDHTNTYGAALDRAIALRRAEEARRG